MVEFHKWPKTPRLLKECSMIITQKLDGTNAQINFRTDEEGILQWKAGSRNRFLTEEKDNFGFYTFVSSNLHRLYQCLGEGTHYGEWCGPGIQTSEGLEERQFFTFQPIKGSGDFIKQVPVMYIGKLDHRKIYECLLDLHENGSKVNGFDRPEGIIVMIGGARYKVYISQLDKVRRAYYV